MLQREIRDLERRRDRLVRETQNDRRSEEAISRGLDASLIDLDSSLFEDPNDPDVAARSAAAAETWEILRAHRLAGASYFSVNSHPDVVGLRLNPSYRGQYGETYYVLFDASQNPDDGHDDDDDGLVREDPLSHTLPPFLPTTEIWTTMKDPRRCVSLLLQYLNALLCRRLQHEMVLERYPNAREQHTPAYDVVSFVGDFGSSASGEEREVTFRYADLRQHLPDAYATTEPGTDIEMEHKAERGVAADENASLVSYLEQLFA